MSILLYTPHLVKELKIKPKHGEPRTYSILLISVVIIMSVGVLMFAGVMLTESSMAAYSTCSEKINGFERSGMYTSPEQFKLALSYCKPL